MAPSEFFVRYTGPRLFPEEPFRQWMHALVRAGVFLGIALLFFSFEFSTVGDAEIQLLLSGVSLDTAPNGQVPHLHFFWGCALAWLYGAKGGVAWFGLLLCMAHWLGIAAAWLALQRIGGGAWRSGMFWLAMFFLEWPFLQQLQLSTSAFVLAQGSLLLLRTSDESDRRSWQGFGISGALFAGAALLYWEAAFLSALIALPLFLVRETDRWAPRVMLAALLLALPFLVGLSDFWLDNGSDPTASGVRSALLEYRDPRYAWTPDNAPRFAQAGWSENDYRLYQAGFAADTSVFGDRSLIRLKEAMASAEATPLSVRMDRGLDVLRQMPPAVERCCLLFLLLVPAVPAEEKRRRALALTILSALAVAWVLSGWFRLPDYLFVPISAWPVLAGLWLTPPLQIFGGCNRIFVTLVALWCAFYGVRTAKEGSRGTLAEYRRWRTSLERLDPRTDRLYLTTGDYHLRTVLPLKRPGDPLIARFMALNAGPLSAGPQWDGQLASFGIRNLHREIAERPDVLWLLPTSAEEFRRLYETFLSEHYGIQAQLISEWEDPSTGMAAWRVQKK